MGIPEISDDALTSLGILLHAKEYVLGDCGSLCVICTDGKARWIGDELNELFDCGIVSDVDGAIALADNARYWWRKLSGQRKARGQSQEVISRKLSQLP